MLEHVKYTFNKEKYYKFFDEILCFQRFLARAYCVCNQVRIVGESKIWNW